MNQKSNQWKKLKGGPAKLKKSAQSHQTTGSTVSGTVRWRDVTSGSAESMTKWSVRHTFRIHLNRIGFRYAPKLSTSTGIKSSNLCL